MKLKFWTAAAVFMGSYFPLSLILLVQDIDASRSWLKPTALLKHPLWSIPPVALTLFCFLATALLLKWLPTKRPLKIIDSKYIPVEMINYTFPYIVSFMSASYDDGPKLAGFTIFVVFLFLITYLAGRAFVNPLLIVFGYRAYEVTYAFAGETSERKTLALARCSDLSVGFVDSAQIEDLLLVRRSAGV